jgi:hypothetical protein
MNEKKLQDQISIIKALDVFVAQLRGLVEELSELIDDYKKACKDE